MCDVDGGGAYHATKDHADEMMRLRIVLLGLCLLPSSAMAAAGADPAGAHDMTHRMMMLVIQLGVILFAAKLGNILFERLRLPGALGELSAGMLIGPYALGKLGFYGFSGGVFPIVDGLSISPELSGICAVAAVVLLFVVGLETDISLLLRYSLAGGLVGLGGVVAAFFAGAGAVAVFSRFVPELFGGQLGLFAPPCLLMGTVATATSVGITARILSDKRKLDSPEGVTILSAAVIDDVMGIIILAVVLGVVSASGSTGAVDWGHIGTIAAKAVGVWLAATAIGLLASRKISVLLKLFTRRTSIAVMALGLALILAGMFEEAGLAMIIGAYVMGISLSKADISHVVREKLEPIYEMLIPVFFCAMGMRIDLGAMGDPGVLAFGAIYAMAALASKVVGGGLPAMLAGFNLRGALRIGFGMAPRCEVALIIAGIGLGAGILSGHLFAAVIIMVVVNTVLAPPALVMLYRDASPGTRRAVTVSAGGKTQVVFELPSHEVTDFLLGKFTGVLQSEGFFAHTLSRAQRLYQLRKDSTTIDVHSTGTELIFDCHRREVALINTAMYEALAALEQTIRGLKVPVNSQAISARMQEHADVDKDTRSMSLASFLHPGLIVPDLTGTTKAEIIDELLAVLDRNHLLRDLASAREAVWTREQSMSTGLQHGVAIPHGKTDAVSRLVCAMGIHREGMDFAAMDNRPSRIFFLTLSPKSKPAPHVQFMSTISQVLNEGGRRRLLAAKTAEDIYDALVSGTEPPPAPPRGEGAFCLTDYIHPELLTADLAGNTKQAVLDELLGMLDRAGAIRDLDMARQAVFAREEQMSTGMEAGIAIPHGRTDAVDSLVCAVGVKRGGVEFGSVDGKATRIIVMALTPPTGTDPYLQLAAAMIGVLDEAGRQRVLAARSAEELHQLLVGPPG